MSEALRGKGKAFIRSRFLASLHTHATATQQRAVWTAQEKSRSSSRAWRRTSILPATGKLGQEDHCKLRPACASIQWNMAKHFTIFTRTGGGHAPGRGLTGCFDASPCHPDQVAGPAASPGTSATPRGAHGLQSEIPEAPSGPQPWHPKALAHNPTRQHPINTARGARAANPGAGRNFRTRPGRNPQGPCGMSPGTAAPGAEAGGTPARPESSQPRAARCGDAQDPCWSPAAQYRTGTMSAALFVKRWWL